MPDSTLLGSLRRSRFGLPLVSLAVDLAMTFLAVALSLYLRLGSDLGGRAPDFVVQTAALVTAVAAFSYIALRLPLLTWRHVSVDELLTIAKAVTLTLMLYAAVTFLLSRLTDVPRSFLLINWLVTMVAVAGPRIAYRLFREGRFRFERNRLRPGQIPVLLVGAGGGAELFLRGVALGAVAQYKPLGIVDDRERSGFSLQGVPVLGRLDAVAELIADLDRRGQKPRKLVVTDPHLSPDVLRALLETATAQGIGLARMPRLAELRPGIEEHLSVRPVAIEDILGRAQAVLDPEPPRQIVTGQTVLITGAGGTIGGELARQIAAFGPARLVLLEASEFNLYSINQEIGEGWPGLPREAVLCDVRQRDALERVLLRLRPDLVFHAAALKHVPLVEANPLEGLWTNSIGTRNLADACVAAGVRAMVLISTDKAVNPPNVMGASKRLAECYCQGLDRDRALAHGTRFITVRFGNVLGSTGSVVPLFQRQLAAGGPLTVTHPEIRRYFMTCQEAVQLVLQASASGVADPDHPGRILVLDMGQPIPIIELARQMIRLAGLRPGIDIDIAITGLRPGEKLSEELFHEAEGLLPTPVPGIFAAEPRGAELGDLRAGLAALESACRAGDGAAAMALLGKFVPEYQILKG